MKLTEEERDNIIEFLSHSQKENRAIGVGLAVGTGWSIKSIFHYLPELCSKSFHYDRTIYQVGNVVLREIERKYSIRFDISIDRKIVRIMIIHKPAKHLKKSRGKIRLEFINKCIGYE